MTRLLFPSIPWIRYIIHTYYSELEEEADARVSEIKTLREKLSAKESEIASKSVELTDRRKSRRLAGEREKQQEQKIEALTEQLEQVKIQAKEENTLWAIFFIQDGVQDGRRAKNGKNELAIYLLKMHLE